MKVTFYTANPKMGMGEVNRGDIVWDGVQFKLIGDLPFLRRILATPVLDTVSPRAKGEAGKEVEAHKQPKLFMSLLQREYHNHAILATAPQPTEHLFG